MLRSRTVGLSIVALLLLCAAGALAVFLLRPPPPPPTAGAWVPIVTTVAGIGIPGARDGAAARAEFSDPFAVAVAPDGTIAVADAGDVNRVRLIGLDGYVRTLAGGGEELRDGRGAAASFHTPSGIAFGPDGVLYVADTGNHAIRRVAPDGAVRTVAGTGEPGFRDGDGIEAQFDGPIGIAVDAAGVVFVADTYNDRIRRIDTQGRVRTIAGSGVPGYTDGAAGSAQFDTPAGIALARDGSLLIADSGNDVLRRLSPDGQVTTVQAEIQSPDGVGWLFRPIGVASGPEGHVYATDRRGRVVHLLAEGGARVLAGSLTGYADGAGAAARFHNPTGLAVDAQGAVVVADASNYVIRRIAPPGLRPPDPPRSPLLAAPGLPGSAFAQAPLPWPVEPQFGWQEVAGTLGEARGSLTGGRERFHAGVDVRADEGAPVVIVRAAKVESPVAALGFGTLNESAAIGPFTYVHLRVGRDRRDGPIDPARFVFVSGEDGRLSRVRVRRGTRFALGDVLGTVNRFRHVHLNAGAPGREVNVLSLTPIGFTDTIPPVFAPRGIRLQQDTGTPLTTRIKGRLVVSGRVRIIAEAWDRVDGNAPRRKLGLYELGYQVLRPDGTPAPGFETPLTTIRFDRLPQQDGAPALVYADGSGIAGQGVRATRFLYTVTNIVRDGDAREAFWDTTTLEPGPYVLRVYGADAAGNRTWAEVRVNVGEGAPLEPGRASAPRRWAQGPKG